MIYGEKAKFAIEIIERCKFDDGSSDYHILFWLNSVSVGDPEESVLNGVVRNNAISFLSHFEVRKKYIMKNVPKKCLAGEIRTKYNADNNLYSVGNKLLPQYGWESVFNLYDIGVEIFDHYNILCCEISETDQSVIWKEHNNEEVFQVILPTGYVENVLKQMLKGEFGVEA